MDDNAIELIMFQNEGYDCYYRTRCWMVMNRGTVCGRTELCHTSLQRISVSLITLTPVSIAHRTKYTITQEMECFVIIFTHCIVGLKMTFTRADYLPLERLLIEWTMRSIESKSCVKFVHRTTQQDYIKLVYDSYKQVATQLDRYSHIQHPYGNTNL